MAIPPDSELEILTYSDFGVGIRWLAQRVVDDEWVPDAILGLKGLKAGSRPYLRDIGDHLYQIAGEFQRQGEDLFALTQTYFNANSDRLNAVATRLTIGGTIFVIYTVVTGFFGQNFGWLVKNIDTKSDFLIFGVGALTLPTVILLTLFWIKRDDWF